MNEVDVLRIAALLHDIGKFWQRAWERPRNNHSELGAEFTEKSEIQGISDLVLNHHSPSNASDKRLAKILQRADWISAAERAESEDSGEVRKEPLRSLFPQIDIGQEEEYDPEKYYYSLSTLDLGDDIFPLPDKSRAMGGEYLDQRYRTLWNDGFVDEFDRIPLNDVNSYYITLHYLLQRYTSFMPSAAYKHLPEIALFDHLRTTSAIADSLYKTGGEEEFLLLRGDISGVQSFIYNIFSPEDAQKGMSKRLRGRSFYLTLLTETIAHHILETLDLTISHLLWCGGGEFLVLLPNTAETIEEMQDLDEQINTTLFEAFQGRIYLALGYAKTDRETLQKDFSSLLEEVSYECTVKKNKKFIDMPEVFEPTPSRKVCPICGSDLPAQHARRFCEECKKQEEWGQKLPRTEYLVEVKSSKGIEYDLDIRFPEFNIYWDLVEDETAALELLKRLEPEENHIDSIVVYRLNNTDFLTTRLTRYMEETSLPVALAFKFLGNTAPYDGDKVLSFTNLAEKSKGANLIGVLRMDVDDLGAIFGVGLTKTDTPNTISKNATLSRLLDLFFLGYLNKICERFPSEDENLDSHLYITYSGGDDLFIVGPWNTIMKAAEEIHKDFKRYTCNNPNINISAGIYHCKPEFPIGRAATYARKILDKSKERGKNSITVFDDTVQWTSENSDRWNGYKELLHYACRLEQLVEDEEISKSFIYSLLNFQRMTFNEIKKDKEHVPLREAERRKKYLPYFKYQLARNVDRSKNQSLFDELDSNIPKIIPWATLPVSWVSLATRSDEVT